MAPIPAKLATYHKPWTQKLVNINSIDYSGGLAEVRAQVEAGNVTWDVVDLELSDAVLGCDEGLFEVIDKSILPNAPDGTRHKRIFCLVPAGMFCCYHYLVTVYAYDTTNLPEKTNHRIFWLKNSQVNVAYCKGAKANLEMAWLPMECQTNQVYATFQPRRLDRAFAKLDSIRDQIVWWKLVINRRSCLLMAKWQYQQL